MKIIVSKKSKEVQFKGVLKKTPDNFYYLDIPESFASGLYSMMEEDADKPPYNLKSFNNVGAHISVIGTDEFKDNNIEKIKEVGKEFNFTIGDVVSLNPEGWDEMKKVWFLQIKSKELEDLRESYGLSRKVDGHEYHITFGIDKK